MSRRTNSFLSPKALAEAIGVSESSIKRWADSGKIKIQRTSGGHRRIPLAEAARFVREERLTLADPASLGLVLTPEMEGLTGAAAAMDPIEVALRRGAQQELHDLLATRYLDGESMAALFDGPLSRGLAAVGELWRESDGGIFVEHRASAALRDALARLGQLVPTPEADAPVAVGGGLSGDPGQLATKMAALTLASEGISSLDLGADTPATALIHAAQEHDADLVWLAVTHQPESPKRARAELELLTTELGERRLVIGCARFVRLDLPRGAMGIGSMSELAALAAGLVSRR